MPDAAERRRLWGALLPSKAPVAEYIKNAVVRAAFLVGYESGEITATHLLMAAQLKYEAMGKLS